MEERKRKNPRPLSVAIVVAEDMVEPLIMGIEDEAKKGSPSPRSLEERNY